MTAWIEVHQTVVRHPKMYVLADGLKMTRPQAMGHLIAIWLWAIDHAENGDLTGVTPRALADAGEYKGKPERLLQALIAAGWVDEDDAGRRLHDWDDYAGRLIRKREQDRDRQRTVRAVSNGHPRDVAGNRTVPNRTVPNQTIPQLRARGCEGLYVEIVRPRKPVNSILRTQFEAADSHGDPCVAWAWGLAAGARDPWQYVQKLFNSCGEEGHGPRERQRNGTAQHGTRQRTRYDDTLDAPD